MQQSVVHKVPRNIPPPHTLIRGRRYRIVSLIGSLACAMCGLFFPQQSQAQTQRQLSVGNGTLTFNETVSTQSCSTAGSGGPQSANYTLYSYDTFSYTDSSNVTTQFDASTSEAFTGGVQCSSPPAQGPNPLQLTLPVGATITFTMSGRGIYKATVSSLVDPLYKVTSILYATPGNSSSDSFTNTTTNGTTTSIDKSYTGNQTATFGTSFLGVGYSVTFGTSFTSGSSNAFTETFSNASSVSNVSATTGPNTVSHNQDLILIWLNPEAELTGTSGNYGYSLHTPYQNGAAQSVDIVEVTAKAMQSNNGSTTVPLSILQRQYDLANGQYDLPGLAHICADQSQYQNNCPNGGQCGCVPGDFTAVLSNDPLLNTTTAINPLTVDTDGAASCSMPNSNSNCRYVPVPSSPRSSYPMTTLLSGPNCAGCNRPVNAFNQTDSTSTTQTLYETHSISVGFTVKFGTAAGPNASLGTSWVWTDKESTGAINGQSNQVGYSLSSSTVGCYQNVLSYEDTVFHTFVSQQAAGNNSCP